MLKNIFLFTSLLFLTIVHAQYTETINSNRPGNSQGAFAVGNQVLQLETGARLGSDEHSIYNTETDLFGIDYEIRYGFFVEQLEVNLSGSYLSSTENTMLGGVEEEYKYSNFERNTLGVKYLVYDPYRKRAFEKPNIYSWKANNRFKWRDLVPVVSIYAGANLLFGDNPYLPPEESSVSPKIALLTQNNWGRWVFVMNFIADRFMGDYPAYSGIFTMTHSVSQKISVFAEYQAIKNDLYSDDIARAGGAYLINKDFQVDVSGLVNFKDTPSRWQVAFGVSYRFDMHSYDEMIMDDGKTEKEDEDEEDSQEGDVDPEGVGDEDNE